MTECQASPAASEISISALLAGQSSQHPAAGCECRLTRIQLQAGMDILLWKGDLTQTLEMNVRDDWNRVNFCYALQGQSQFTFGSLRGESDYLFDEGMSCISYTPGCRGKSAYSGKLESLSIAIEPELVHDLVPGMDGPLQAKLKSGQCYIQNRYSAEIRGATQALSRSLNCGYLCSQRDVTDLSRLWLLGQSLILVSLTIRSCVEDGKVIQLNAAERHKLLRARDMLLADLTKAPTIAMLAKDTGLTILKLKQGFRQMFDESVYGLFQQERMQDAKRRLQAGNASVMIVAADLGYTNASHFAAAFQKQFGVKPSAVKHWQ